MEVPIYVQEEVVDEEKYFTRPWQILFETLLQNLQQNFGTEGCVIPPLTLAEIQQVAAGKNADGNFIALGGTLLFATDVVNGGTTAKPNGQLQIILQNGVVRAIPNA
jgi:hypothetical protein